MLNRLADGIDTVLEWSGRALAIFPLCLILVQFLVVLMVYVFGIGSIQLQESLLYINACIFLGGAGFTALRDSHVRVDLFYSKMNDRRRTLVNMLGTLFLLVPFLSLFWISSVPYVLDSWAIWETSVEASGLPFVYLLKSTLLLFALSLSLHAIASVCRAIAILTNKK